MKLLQDKDKSVRAAAAFALGQLAWFPEFAGGREGDIQTALTVATKDSHQRVQVRAIEALGKIGLTKTPEIVKPLLDERDKDLREEAVWALFRFRQVLKSRELEKDPGPLSQEVFAKLEKLAADSSDDVRRAVAYYFARNVDERAEAALRKLAADEGMWTRMFAFSGLAKMKAKNSKAAIETGLKDREPVVRYAALNALAASGEKAGHYAFLATDKSFHVRTVLAQNLDTAVAENVRILNAFLETDKSLSVRAEALKTLAKVSRPDLSTWLSEKLRDSRWQIREAAVAAAENLSGAAKEEFLSKAMGDSDTTVRVAALEVLGKIPGETGLKAVTKALESGALSERGTAVTSLGERTEDVLELAWKTYLGSQDRRWIEAREGLVDIFAKTKNKATTETLKKILKDPAPSVASKARKELLDRGESGLPEIQESELTFSPFRELSLNGHPSVTFETTKGTFRIETYPEDAPIHVANLIGQVRKGFYNGLSWHRVVSNFVVQGGDPDNSGWGDAGYNLRAEINTRKFKRGTLGMPRSRGFNTGGVQLFFNHIPTPHLDGQYTVFGQVTSGFDVIDKLERGDRILRAY